MTGSDVDFLNHGIDLDYRPRTDLIYFVEVILNLDGETGLPFILIGTKIIGV